MTEDTQSGEDVGQRLTPPQLTLRLTVPGPAAGASRVLIFTFSSAPKPIENHASIRTGDPSSNCGFLPTLKRRGEVILVTI
jgi:hypothetical protein